MRDQTLQLAKESQIKDAFAKLNGLKKYTRQHICEKLAQQFFLQASTIERIVWGEYDTNRKRRIQRRTATGAQLQQAA